MKMLWLVSLLFAITGLGVPAPPGTTQSTIDPGSPCSITDDSPSPTIKCRLADLAYPCRTLETMVRACSFDVFGPSPIVGAATEAAPHQAVETPLDSVTQDRTPCSAACIARHFPGQTPPAPETAEDRL
jgi:hypothetical protein